MNAIFNNVLLDGLSLPFAVEKICRLSPEWRSTQEKIIKSPQGETGISPRVFDVLPPGDLRWEIGTLSLVVKLPIPLGIFPRGK